MGACGSSETERPPQRRPPDKSREQHATSSAEGGTPPATGDGRTTSTAEVDQEALVLASADGDQSVTSASHEVDIPHEKLADGNAARKSPGLETHVETPEGQPEVQIGPAQLNFPELPYSAETTMTGRDSQVSLPSMTHSVPVMLPGLVEFDGEPDLNEVTGQDASRASRSSQGSHAELSATPDDKGRRSDGWAVNPKVLRSRSVGERTSFKDSRQSRPEDPRHAGASTNRDARQDRAGSRAHLSLEHEDATAEDPPPQAQAVPSQVSEPDTTGTPRREKIGGGPSGQKAMSTTDGESVSKSFTDDPIPPKVDEEEARLTREKEARLREAAEAQRLQREAEVAAKAAEAKRLKAQEERLAREAAEAERVRREREAAETRRRLEEAARRKREEEERNAAAARRREEARLRREAEEREAAEAKRREEAERQKRAREAREAEEASRRQREEAERLAAEAAEAQRLEAERRREQEARLRREREEAEARAAEAQRRLDEEQRIKEEAATAAAAEALTLEQEAEAESRPPGPTESGDSPEQLTPKARQPSKSTIGRIMGAEPVPAVSAAQFAPQPTQPDSPEHTPTTSTTPQRKPVAAQQAAATPMTIEVEAEPADQESAGEEAVEAVTPPQSPRKRHPDHKPEMGEYYYERGDPIRCVLGNYMGKTGEIARWNHAKLRWGVKVSLGPMVGDGKQTKNLWLEPFKIEPVTANYRAQRREIVSLKKKLTSMPSKEETAKNIKKAKADMKKVQGRIVTEVRRSNKEREELQTRIQEARYNVTEDEQADKRTKRKRGAPKVSDPRANKRARAGAVSVPGWVDPDAKLTKPSPAPARSAKGSKKADAKHDGAAARDDTALKSVQATRNRAAYETAQDMASQPTRSRARGSVAQLSATQNKKQFQAAAKKSRSGPSRKPSKSVAALKERGLVSGAKQKRKPMPKMDDCDWDW